MAATAQSGKRGDDLVSGTPFDLGSAQTTKPKTRVPEILLGTFLVAVFALAGAWFYSTSTSSRQFVALRAPVQRGQQIEATDLDFFEINTDEEIEAIPASDYLQIVGKLAITDLAAGTLLTPAQFTDQADIAPGFGIVGLALETGEYPTIGLRPGDWVRIVAVPESRNDGENVAADVLAERVQVVEVVGDSAGARFISVTTDTETADVVASVEAEGRIRLIQIPDGATGQSEAETTDEAPSEPTGQTTDEVTDE